VDRGRRRRGSRGRPHLPRPGKRKRGSPLSGLPTDVVRLKAHRHCYITATRLRQVRKWQASAGFPPAPAFYPRILARPGGVGHTTADVPDRRPVPATPVATEAVPPSPPVAASVLALGHSDPRPWGGGDGIPADCPDNGARTGKGLRRRLGGRARRERTRFRRHAAAVADTTHAPGTPSGGGEVLLFSLYIYRIVASLGLVKLSLRAFGVVVDTGVGPNLVRRDALAPDWLRQVVTSKEEEQARLRDAKNARLRASGPVTLWLQTGARIVPVPFLVVEDLSVPVILVCTFIDDNAHATLPQDRSSRWTGGSVTTILRGPLDDGDRSMGVSCVLRATNKTRLPPSAATVVWVRTKWGGLGCWTVMLVADFTGGSRMDDGR